MKPFLALGYREARPGRWAKPAGYHLFTFNESFLQWANWFKAADGSGLLCWDSNKIDASHDVYRQLTEWEAYTNISCGDSAADFKLSAIDF